MRAGNLSGSCYVPPKFGGSKMEVYSIGVFYEKHWKVYIPCKSCGTFRWVEERALTQISARSKGSSICRKCQSKRLTDAYRTHGSSRPGSVDYDLYTVWTTMKQRCKKKTNKSYSNYGGRGISVCQEWSSFENFKRDMYPRPKGKSLDRIDNDGPYSKENCRWATAKQQANNQRTNVRITIDERTQTLMQWVNELGVPYARVYSRIEAGWAPEDALMKNKKGTTINGETKTVREWCSQYNVVDHITAKNRIGNGWDLFLAITTPKMR
jgi:hypothetical protein